MVIRSHVPWLSFAAVSLAATLGRAQEEAPSDTPPQATAPAAPAAPGAPATPATRAAK